MAGLIDGAPTAAALLEAMSEAVYAVDGERRITFWSPAAELLTGYTASEAVGRRCRDNLLGHVDGFWPPPVPGRLSAEGDHLRWVGPGAPRVRSPSGRSLGPGRSSHRRSSLF